MADIELPARLYHVDRALFGEGDRIKAGNWGRIVLGTGGRHHLFFREAFLESVRQREFHDAPSRLQSAFSFSNEAVAGAFLKQEVAPRSPSGDPQEDAAHLYLVGIADPEARSGRFDMEWIELLPSVHSVAAAERLAKNYWSGKRSSRPKWEWLTEGDLQVIDRLSELVDDDL